MSTVIEKLRLQGFEGYREAEAEFTPGLNLVTGRNSTGKSALLDATHYALFGEVPGVDKKLLVSRITQARAVKAGIRFVSPMDGSIVEVLRSGRLRPDGGFRSEEYSLIVDGRQREVRDEEDLRKKVAEFLGLSPKRFLNLAYVRQGELTRILRPDPDDLDTALGITLLRELREQLDEVRKDLETFEGVDALAQLQNLEDHVIPTLTRLVSELSVSASELERKKHELEEKIRKAESEEARQILQLVVARDQLQEEVEKATERESALLEAAGTADSQELQRRLSSLDADINNKGEQASSLGRRVEELRQSYSALGGRLEVLGKELEQRKELAKKGLGECPLCGQKLDIEHLVHIVSAAAQTLPELERKALEAKTDLEFESSRLQALERQIIELEADIRRLKEVSSKVEQEEGKRSKARAEANRITEQMKSLAASLGIEVSSSDSQLNQTLAQTLINPEELVKLRQEVSEVSRQYEKKKDELDNNTQELENYRRRVEAIRKRLSGAAKASSLFKSIESAIEDRRREILRRVEHHALAIYNELTDQRLYTAFRIDPESYEIYVRPRGQPEDLPATRVGGGHQTLVAMSARLALLKALKKTSLLILDEPTYGVDSENLPQLVSHLAEAAKHVSQVILVTHHGLGIEEANNIIRVELGPDGASKLLQG